MANENELNGIRGYPDIIEHIVDISQVVRIRLQDQDSYSFTVGLDNYECINVSRACDDNSQSMDIFLDMSNLRRRLELMVIMYNPDYNTIPLVQQDDISLLGNPQKKEIS